MFGAYFFVARLSIYSELAADVDYNDYKVEDFVRFTVPGQKMVTEASSIGADGDGDYKVRFKALGLPVSCLLHVTDSVPPQVEAKEAVSVFTTQDVKCEDFIVSCEDRSPVSFSWGKDYDFTSEGQLDVVVVATDSYGNSTEVTVPTTIINDVVPPIIDGVNELWVIAGGTISYKRYISLVDDYDDNPMLDVDSSQVDLNKEGVYEIVYIATDAAGNVAKEKTKVNVTTSPVDVATEEEVYEKADEVLAEILKPGMTQYQQAEAIFWWCYNNITYLEGTPKDTWVKGAYRGLFNHRGDCSVSQATARCLLTRAGIKNMEIDRNMDIGGYHHYWNLVDFGDGWRHFDTMDNVFHVPIFGWSADELHAWAPDHWNMHHYYDKDYPGIVQNTKEGTGTFYYVIQGINTEMGEVSVAE